MLILKPKIRLVLVFILGVFSVSAAAFGLSDIELNSSLNQKLDASIQLTSVNAEEAALLSILVNNAERAYSLKHEVISVGNKQILKITSDKVIKEPIITVNLDINGQSGRLVREYTLLIDPPGK